MLCVMRMDADAGVDPIVSFSERDAAAHCIRTAAIADRQDLTDAGIPCPLQDRIAVIIKTGIVDVSVRIDKHEK